MVGLRRRADQLSESGLAYDQITCCAMQTASDDIAWGRSPLAHWPTFFSDAWRPEDGAREAIRRRLVLQDDRVLEDAVAAEIESRAARHGGDAFLAAKLRWSLLDAAWRLQASLWDDPRLLATDVARLRMRAGALGLRRRLLVHLPRPTPPASNLPSTARFWRRRIPVVRR